MMGIASFLSYVVYCVVMTGTPGPNNAMILTSGARFGYGRTLPLIAGIAVGTGLQLFAVGYGLGALLTRMPGVYAGLKFVCAAYLTWLALKIARSGPVSVRPGERPPLGFFGFIAFQWVNPKAWAMTTSAVALYLPAAQHPSELVLGALTISLISLPCVSVWALGGAALRTFLTDPRNAALFNVSAAFLLLAVTLPILLH